MADRTGRERAEYAAGIGAATLAVALAVADVSPFEAPPDLAADAPIWEILLLHGAVPGFLRLALVMVALYGIASVPALIVSGRWAKGFGTSGLIADEARAATESALAGAERHILALEAANARFQREYEEVAALLDSATAPE